MRKFQTIFDGEVDLDNPKTYAYLPDDKSKLDNLMFEEIGKALVYMDYFHPDWYPEEDLQRQRVLKLIDGFTKGRHNNYDNTLWLKEQIFIFQEECENMC